MSTPLGHAVVAAALARRLGVRSPSALAAAAVAANLPDVDIVVGLILHGDPWKLHRRGSHSLAFAAATGAVLGGAGVISTRDATGERDVARDMLNGVLIVASHAALDRAPYRPIRVGPRLGGMRLLNWALDAVQCAVFAWVLWPRADRPSGRQVPRKTVVTTALKRSVHR